VCNEEGEMFSVTQNLIERMRHRKGEQGHDVQDGDSGKEKFGWLPTHGSLSHA
jgi:hypothetical protein